MHPQTAPAIVLPFIRKRRPFPVQRYSTTACVTARKGMQSGSFGVRDRTARGSKEALWFIGRSCVTEGVHMPNKKKEQRSSDGKRIREHVRKVLANLAALQEQKRAQIKVSR